MSTILTRRALIGGLVAGGGALVSGCDAVFMNGTLVDAARGHQDANFAIQRLLQNRTALATEYLPSQRSPVFRANGTRLPVGQEYANHITTKFANWNLVIDGLVARPQALPLNAVKAMPARSQITRHDCVEGWSAIAKWTGVPMKLLLDRAGLAPNARYVILWCADANDGAPYYESIDLVDAMHPQTMLAWALNDELIPVQNGAPLRLRVERQLGYKHAKYVQRLQVVDSFANIRGGKGGFWEDGAGYEWYAGL